jgi:hypothetical protein
MRLKDAMDDMKEPGEGLQLYAQVRPEPARGRLAHACSVPFA